MQNDLHFLLSFFCSFNFSNRMNCFIVFNEIIILWKKKNVIIIGISVDMLHVKVSCLMYFIWHKRIFFNLIFFWMTNRRMQVLTWQIKITNAFSDKMFLNYTHASVRANHLFLNHAVLWSCLYYQYHHEVVLKQIYTFWIQYIN